MSLISTITGVLEQLRNAAIQALVDITDAEYRGDPNATPCNNEYFNNNVHLYLKALGWAVHNQNVLLVKADAPNDFNGSDPDIFQTAQEAANAIPTTGADAPSGTNPYVIIGDPTVDFSAVNWTNHINAGTRQYITVGNIGGGGTISVNVAGNTDVTLNIGQAAHNVIICTGVLTGSINLIVPLIDGWQWIVFNNTTGAYTLTVKGATGTGIAITQGKTATVYTDATNVYRATADV
jgi:hypothetical protein